MLTKVLPHAVYVCLVLTAVLQSLTYGFVATVTLVVVLLLVRVRQHDTIRDMVEEILPADKVSVIAHRGGGHDAPENTLAAFREVGKNRNTLAKSKNKTKCHLKWHSVSNQPKKYRCCSGVVVDVVVGV